MKATKKQLLVLQKIEHAVRHEVRIVFALARCLPETQRYHGSSHKGKCNNPRCQWNHGKELHTRNNLTVAAEKLHARGLIGKDVLAQFKL